MRTTLDIDALLLKKLRLEAHRRGVPFKDVVAGALRRGLEPSTARGAPTMAALPSYSMGEPALNVDKATQFAAALEDDAVIRKLSARK